MKPKSSMIKDGESINSCVSEIRELIVNDKLELAFEQMRDLFTENKKFNNEIDFQVYRYRNLMKGIREGIIKYDDVNIDKNKMVKAALNLLDEIDQNNPAENLPKEKTTQKSKILLPFLFIALIGYIMLLIFGKNIPNNILYHITLVPIILFLSGNIFLSKPKINPFKLIPSFYNGLYGGLLGGALAGIIIAVSYSIPAMEYIQSEIRESWELSEDYTISELSRQEYYGDFELYQEVKKRFPILFLGIIFFTILVGGTTCFMHFGMSWFMRFEELNKGLAILLGAISGGVVFGAIDGLVGVILFMDFYALPIRSIQILIAGGIGSICVIMGSLYYSYKGNWRYIILSLFFSLLIAGVFIALGSVIVDATTFNHYIDFTSDDQTGRLSGMLLGAVSGLVFGFIIGLTIVFYNIRNYEQKQEEAIVSAIYK